MPEKPLTIATYAAGASLAAITLVYVFGPTFFLDDEAAQSSKSSRKKGVVGLSNPANDCFINSVLQTLAGLPELRTYLIREVHRRELDGPELYKDLTAALEEQRKSNGKDKTPEWKLLGRQQGLVTIALKDVLDSLNERPIYRKTISARGFIRVVEQAFRTSISRQQQDAQEFLQIVVERLADEYHAGNKARRKGKQQLDLGIDLGGKPSLENLGGMEELDKSEETIKPKKNEDHGSNTELQSEEHTERINSKHDPQDDGTGRLDSDKEIEATSNGNDTVSTAFPFEGKLESQIECSHCHFKPKPSVSSFVTLTLNVPQHQSSTSLNACFDGMLKVEHIDDFKCDRCRLDHALQVKTRTASKTSLGKGERAMVESDIEKIRIALAEDPEKPPKDVKLPDLSTVPKRRISRHMRISSFPRILAIHLSRSMWDVNTTSAKNMAKVSFPETLPLGGLLDRKTYRLLGVVTHKGGHNSGHYESFRRQVLSLPYSTPHSFGTEGIYSVHPSPKPSVAPSPRVSARDSKDLTGSQPTTPETQALSSGSNLSPASSSASSRSLTSLNRRKPPPTSTPLEAIPTPGLPTPPTEIASPRKRDSVTAAMDISRFKRKQKKGSDRWWRISDDKIKESKTSEVLGMQREVYMLFYEMLDEA